MLPLTPSSPVTLFDLFRACVFALALKSCHQMDDKSSIQWGYVTYLCK